MAAAWVAVMMMMMTTTASMWVVPRSLLVHGWHSSRVCEGRLETAVCLALTTAPCAFPWSQMEASQRAQIHRLTQDIGRVRAAAERAASEADARLAAANARIAALQAASVEEAHRTR